MKKNCPECGSRMHQSKWTGLWHCENIECKVYLDAEGKVRHKTIALVDMGERNASRV